MLHHDLGILSRLGTPVNTSRWLPAHVIFIVGSLYAGRMLSADANVVNLWRNQQLSSSPTLRSSRALVDARIRTLRDSRKHIIIPWKNRPVGASALAFDDAEQRFLLCGSCVGDVSIIDIESPMKRDLNTAHTTYRSPISQRHRFLVSGCQFYPVDSGMFATSSMDQEVRLWDSECMRVVDKYKNETAILDLHWGMPSGSGIIAIALGSSCVRLIDPRTRNHIHHMRWKGKFAKCLRWMNSPSHLLLAGSETGNMVLWDIRSARSELMEVVSNGTAGHNNDRRPKAAKAHTCCISSIRCSKDGRYVVSMANDKRINVWDATSMQLQRSFKIRDVDGQCTSMAEVSDEGNELYGFVGIDKALVICRLTPQPLSTPSRPFSRIKIKRPSPPPPASKDQIKTETSPPPPSQRVLRSHVTTRPAAAYEHRVIRAHFQVIMATAYRRNYQHVITSSGDGSTLAWCPEVDEELPDQKRAEIETLYQDDFSDED